MKNLALVSGYTTIPSQSRAECRRGEIPKELSRNNKLIERLEGKVKRYQFFQQPIDTLSSVLQSKPHWLSGKLEQCQQQITECRAAAKKLRAEEERLSKVQEFWNHVSEWIRADRDLPVSNLSNFCKDTQKKIKEFNQFQAYVKEYTKLDGELKKLKVKLESCERLERKLSALIPPGEYAKQFIETNLTEISQIFINLHMPQEFTNLKIMDGEIVPLINMSTGQRTALVFSVFFQLNLSNSSAPQFLLIDEPVANIDDLNALLLMDFLRELVITHKKQLFVTTANRNVALLFRRKFSFLNDSLYETSFYRESKDLLEIIQRKYDQRQLLSEDKL